MDPSATMLRRQHRNAPAEETLPLHGSAHVSTLRQENSTIHHSLEGRPLHAKVSHSVDALYQEFVRRRWYVCYPLAFLVIIVSILLFGTIYSRITTRDPCQVLQSTIRPEPTQDMPKLFHYQSKSDTLTMETKTWRKVLDIELKESQVYPNIHAKSKEWSSVYWSDEACAALVRDHFATFTKVYDGFPHTIQRVDSCRYLLLLTYGGVYADTDISIHSDADTLERLVPDGVGLVESPFRYNEVWQNSLMTATKPEHPFWKTTIKIMTERAGSDVVLFTTGPKMIGDAVERYRAEGGEGVSTLPCELFQRLPSGQWETTLLNILGRDVLARAVPMKGCGRYGDGQCEITRHAGKASWTKASGKII